MSIKDRYTSGTQDNPRWGAILRDGIILLAVLIFLMKMWPFYSVPTGSRGVVTQFGKIVGIEQEGLAVLPPWQNLTLFSIRAEEANIDNASGSTSDTQPVSVSLTVRYSISADKVSEVCASRSNKPRQINGTDNCRRMSMRGPRFRF
jgi:regulator of protease activity HflC (stomatin/prohibitin superfamily)